MTLLSFYVIAVAFYNYLLLPGAIVTRPPWLMGLVVMAWAVIASVRTGSLPRPGAFGLALILFAITTIANGVGVWLSQTANFTDYLRTEFQFVLVLGVVFAFARVRLDERRVATLLRVWVWTAGAASVVGIYQAFARVVGLSFPDLPISAKGFEGMVVKQFFGFFAISSWFAEPSWLGSFLLVPLLYLTGVILFDMPPPFGLARGRAGLLVVLLALGLFLSLSQAAYATVLILSVPVLWSVRASVRLGRALSVVGVTALLLFGTTLALTQAGANVIEAQRSRFNAVMEAWRTPDLARQITSYGVRVTNMQSGIELWLSRPVLGVGINNVRHHPRAGLLLSDPESGSVDSGLLQLLVEQGLLGFGAFGLAVVIIWRRLRIARAQAKQSGPMFLLWFLSWALVTDVVNSFVTHPWQHPQRWLVLSIAASYLAFLTEEARVTDLAGTTALRAESENR